MADLNSSKSTQDGGNQVATPVDPEPYLTSWCGGMGCDNCKLCLIFSGKAKLIKADEKSHKLTYRITEE